MKPAAMPAARARANDLNCKESLMSVHQNPVGEFGLSPCQQSNIATATAIKLQMQRVLAGGAALELDLAALLAAGAPGRGVQG
jgi:hypothetical protein